MAIYKQGMTNPYVGTIQKSLADLGYNTGPIDNIYGPKTAAAVKQFQTDRGITADSIWGPQTQGAFDAYKTTALPSTSDRKVYSEGGISYENIGGQIYKDGKLISPDSYKYIPSAIGGLRDSTPVADNTQLPQGGDTVVDPNYPQAQYSPEIMEWLASLQTQSQTPWQYDPTKDPLYGPLKQQYEQMGSRAFSDTIGKLSALTGGRPSSAGIGTAAGAQNQYMQQFAGTVLPSLTEQAFNRDQAQLNNQLNLLKTGMSAEDSMFDRAFALTEFEWRRSENNPAYKAQLLNNLITQFQIDHQGEEWAYKAREWEAAISQAETIARYAPAQAEAELNRINAEIANTQSITKSRNEADNVVTTGTGTTETTPEQSPLYKDANTTVSGMMKNMRLGTAERALAAKNVISMLEGLVTGGQLTAEEADAIARVNGLTDSDFRMYYEGHTYLPTLKQNEKTIEID